MGGTAGRITVAFVVHKEEHLPEGIDADAVKVTLDSVVSSAVSAWYTSGGSDLLRFEPLVHISE